jgi:hypothetical protein
MISSSVVLSSVVIGIYWYPTQFWICHSFLDKCIYSGIVVFYMYWLYNVLDIDNIVCVYMLDYTVHIIQYYIMISQYLHGILYV